MRQSTSTNSIMLLKFTDLYQNFNCVQHMFVNVHIPFQITFYFAIHKIDIKQKIQRKLHNYTAFYLLSNCVHDEIKFFVM